MMEEAITIEPVEVHIRLDTVDEPVSPEEYEVDRLTPCCGLGCCAMFQNCSVPTCIGCHAIGTICCCDIEYVSSS